MILYHIRAPLARRRGNQLYRDRSPRISVTLCREPVTDHDIRYSWQALPCGDYEPCAKCVEIRNALRREAS